MNHKSTESNNNSNSIIDRVEGLPPIQLPPPIVHFYIGPPPHSPQSWQPPSAGTQVYLPPTPPHSSSTSKPDHKENIRRTSHSAVEKRRRERMNDKIEKLKTLIPSCNAQFPTTVQQPIHKLSVLQAAIDYIGELHNQLETSLPKDNPLLKDIAFMQKKDKIK